jgi:hypothetical protein
VAITDNDSVVAEAVGFSHDSTPSFEIVIPLSGMPLSEKSTGNDPWIKPNE